MYKIINEDNSLVTEYPSNILYDKLSESEKQYIQIFKKELDKLAEKEGLSRSTVSISYAGDIFEKDFEIKDKTGYAIQEYEEIVENITWKMYEFCKDDEGLKSFFGFSNILTV